LSKRRTRINIERSKIDKISIAMSVDFIIKRSINMLTSLNLATDNSMFEKSLAMR